MRHLVVALLCCVLLTAGCAGAVREAPLPPDHPASPEAAEAAALGATTPLVPEAADRQVTGQGSPPTDSLKHMKHPMGDTHAPEEQTP